MGFYGSAVDVHHMAKILVEKYQQKNASRKTSTFASFILFGQEKRSGQRCKAIRIEKTETQELSNQSFMEG
jgi:hypothetical protein